MQVIVNGAIEQLDSDTTVEELVRDRAAGHRHVAVALNGAVVPRSAWSTTTLAPDDRVEVLAAVAGG